METKYLHHPIFGPLDLRQILQPKFWRSAIQMDIMDLLKQKKKVIEDN